MFDPRLILLVLLGYIAFLFLLANWAQRRAEEKRKAPSGWIYALSICVFCTSWTFYGSVGAAANGGISFLAVYFGPTLVLLFAGTLVRKMVRLKSLHHITSIADLISTRYNKSQGIAALVTLICLVGILPYIALQLKAITTTFELIASRSVTVSSFTVEWVTVVLMTLFTILFGVRQLDPTERHQGMMFALAAESLVKLIAFLAVGLFVSFGLFDGLGDLFTQAQQHRQSLPALANLTAAPPFTNWVTLIVLSMAAFMFLPRQFHVMVVENADEQHISTAQWLVPAYLLLINIFVLPIAAAGLLQGMGPDAADSYVLRLPLLAEQNSLSLLVFIGGFSAATGMILVSAMTLSTMITNHLLLPVIEVLPGLRRLRVYLLQWRWLAVTLFIAGGALFNHTLGESYMLVNMGLISFAAVLQFAPALIGGLFWRQGSARGASAGLLAGFGLWAYTLLLPAFSKSGWIGDAWLTEGPLGLGLLTPESLFGFTQLAPLPHAVFWSLAVNLLAYIGVSIADRPGREGRALANEFVDILLSGDRPAPAIAQENTIHLPPKVHLLRRCFADYLPPAACNTALEHCLASAGLSGRNEASLMEMAYLQKEAENLLAGAIGGASAHKAMQRCGLFRVDEQEQLSSLYSRFLAEIHLTPEELLSKIDYYQEREQMIADHTAEQDRTIERLESEVAHRLAAERALQELNEKLEQRVEQRTTELKSSNLNLRTTLQQLQQTQRKLVEADKMAALGGLVAGVAHEINTPLGNSLTAVTLLKDEFQRLAFAYQSGDLKRSDLEAFNAVAEESLDIIHSNATRAAQLVQSFKQVAVDQASDEERSFPVRGYIEEVLFSLRPQLKHTPHRVEVNGDPDITIDSYPGAFSQIITNLVMNSLQHGFEEQEAAGLIRIDLAQEDDTLRLEYSDDGRGMSQRQLRRIFEPFYTTRRGRGGSGLGAHIIYNLVTQRLGGEIDCDSEPGKGTHFKITLPLHRPAEPESESEAERSPP
ncbi:ATP-binding protein [Motiliproteus sp. SC1-56]|uniref:ATP-binding protein n=1 Tax=Motiliproteus sp. SC1-56 TaxID=2799565 RepID=UPI001A8DB2A1|nr:ATP-binding protein [Motiliproteus sp. SC1-56]